MEVRLEQPEKAQSLIFLRFIGIFIVCKLVHLKKAAGPMLVTLFGRIREFKFEQPLKAFSPIIFKQFGILTETKLVQSKKTLSFMPSTS